MNEFESISRKRMLDGASCTYTYDTRLMPPTGNVVAPNAQQTHPAFSPQVVVTHSCTHRFLASALGDDRWASIAYHLARPPMETCVRVNTLRMTREEAMERLRDELPGYQIEEGPLPMSVMVRGSRRDEPIVYDDEILKGREMIVGMGAGQAMLKGAELYAPGVLACTKNLQPGDRVAVSIGVPINPEKNLYGITRQATLPPYVPLDDERFPNRRELFIGTGEMLLGRREITNPNGGQVMVMREKIYDLPSLPNEFMEGLVMNQAFPSLLAACVLAPAPGSTVLDMCAAPGGKTTAMAELMGNCGKIYAVDRTNKKVLKVQEFAEKMGIDIVVPVKGDATTLLNPDKTADAEITVESVSKHVETQSARSLQAVERKRLARIRHGHESVNPRARAKVAVGGFAPESFDYILLDAACSALGIRPRFIIEDSLDELLKSAMYSRKMLDQAAQLLKPGGTLVYSTCTISPLENEANVRHVLDAYPEMKLVGAGPGLHHGGPGLTGVATVTDGKKPFELLKAEEAALVQRFDPSDDNNGRSHMGFFIAKFVKEGRATGEESDRRDR